MKALRWNLERFLILAIRRPRYYLMAVSTLCSGLFSSLEIFEPIRRYIDNIPYITASDWLYFIVMTVLFGCFFYGLSFIVCQLWGLQPFDYIASYIDSTGLAPSLASYAEQRLRNANGISKQRLEYRLRKINSDELPVFNQINREVFRFTAFALPLHKINQRNNALFQKNSSMFAMVEAELGGRYIPVGMSHILVLNDLGKSLYVKQNGLKDSDIVAEHIARKGEWSNCIVLFSMGLLPAFRNALKHQYLMLPYVFADHLVSLLKEMRDLNPNQSQTSVYCQTEKALGGIGKLIAALGFKHTDIISGDGYALWEMKIENIMDDPARIHNPLQERLKKWTARLLK